MIPLVGDRQRIYEQTLESMEVTISLLYIFIFELWLKFNVLIGSLPASDNFITAASFANIRSDLDPTV